MVFIDSAVTDAPYQRDGGRPGRAPRAQERLDREDLAEE